MTDAEVRIAAALELHRPHRICGTHHLPDHACGQDAGWLFRCYVCARTRHVPCRTWQILTGLEKPA